MALSWNDLPEFAKQAAKETNHEDPGHAISPFLARWGGYSPEILQRAVLEEGSGDDRIFAITALGLLDASDDSEALLLPLLDSADVKVRWASAIALGRHKHERVFPVLQDLLVENIFDYENFSLFDWQLPRRCTIVFLLGAWGRAEAVVALRHALQTCWEIEQRFNLATEPGHVVERTQWWHYFEDHLACALGRLGAWGAIGMLGLSTVHLRVAIIFLALGSLHIDTQRLFRLGRAPNVFNQSHYPPSTLALFASRPDPPLFVEPEVVARILLERFGLSETEQRQYIQDFAHNYGIGRLEEDNYITPEGLDDHPF